MTGALVTLNAVAEALSDALGKEIPYVQAPIEAAQKMIRDQGAPDWAAEHVGNIVKDIGAGSMSRDTGQVAALLGRPARTLAAFIADNAAAYRS